MLKLKPVAVNMTEVQAGNVTVLFSYQTPVACFMEGSGYYVTECRFSAATTRHVAKWLARHRARNPSTKPQVWFDTLLTATVREG